MGTEQHKEDPEKTRDWEADKAKTTAQHKEKEKDTRKWEDEKRKNQG